MVTYVYPETDQSKGFTPPNLWCYQSEHNVRLYTKKQNTSKQRSLVAVPANPPAVISSQVLNTTTERPQSLHPHWVTNTKYHLLWYHSLSQTACRITEMLIILLVVFLHKQDRARAKMFWGVISMLLWSGVMLPFGVLFMKTHVHTNTHTHASPAVVGNWWWPQIYGWQSGSRPAVIAGDLPRLPYLPPWPVTSGWPSC